jgi:hypothetical protein
MLIRAFFRWSDGGEVLPETRGVLVQQFRYPFMVGRAHDEADMPRFVYAVDDLGIVVAGSVRIFLPRQRDGNAAVPFTRFEGGT